MSGLHAAFEALLADWAELALTAGRVPSQLVFTPATAERARGRIAQLRALGDAGVGDDRALLHQQARLFDWLLDSQRWRGNPDVLSDWSVLLLRPSLEEGRDAEALLEALLLGLPGALAGALHERARPDALALALALEAGDGVRSQLDALAPRVAASALAPAQQALEAHLEALAGLSAGAPLPPLGPETLAELFALRQLPWSPEEALARVEDELSRLRADPLLQDLAPRRASARAVHPTTEAELYQAMSSELERARQSWSALGLPPCTLRIEVRPTPAALRPTIPGAAVFTPRPLRPDEPALVVLTAPEDLSRRHLGHLANLAVHEGPPGHLLQAELSNRAQRPWRAVDLCPVVGLGAGLFACELMEGWPHFAEERLAEAGHARSDRERFVQRDEALWRAVRAQADLRLHLGQWTEAEAAHALVTQVGMAPELAQAEVDDLWLQPTYGCSYLLGKLLLRERRGADEAQAWASLLGEGLRPLAESRASPPPPLTFGA